MKAKRVANKRQGFTLVEILVVVVVVFILSTLLVPALCQSRTPSRIMDCMNNQKQIVLAAKMYAGDNQDDWMPNYPGQSPTWAGGIMNFDPRNTDNTNAAKLVDATYSVLAPYARNPAIYHCPGDPSFVAGEGIRVRSVSMSQAVGTVGKAVGPLKAGDPVNGQWLTGRNISSSIQTTWRTYGKISSMVDPTPASLWVFIDEHPDSINDGGFAVQMQYTGAFGKIIDVPASYHNGAAGISFADGHAEIHRWLGSTIKPPVINGGIVNGGTGTTVADSAADLTWLQSHTSAHR